jgi:hypothetical protein
MRPELESVKQQLEAAIAPPPALPRFDPHFVRNRDVMLRFLEGQSISEIALDLRLEPKQVKAILRRSPIKLEVQRLAGLANDRYVQERIDSLSIEALDVVRDTMRGTQFNELRFKAAKQVLDLNPLLKAGQKSDMEHLGAGLGEAIINRLSKLDAEAAKQKEEIDVTPTLEPATAGEADA